MNFPERMKTRYAARNGARCPVEAEKWDYIME